MPKKPNLAELIQIASTVEYLEPDKPKEQWTDDDYFFKSIYIALHNPDQVHASNIICGWFPPMKVLFKAKLNAYLVYCSKISK